ncbi:MAG: response regulator [bacterium]|nr:response regulator [bacterium]
MFEKVTGYTSAETIGQNPRILKSDSAPYPPEYYKVMWETLKKGDIWKGDFTNNKKNGEIFIEEASIFPFRDPESGEITGYGGIKKDITLRRKLEVQLKKSYNQVLYLKDKAEDANRLKSQFLANMSHDIRTPLNAVMGFTDLLSKDERRKKSLDYLNKIKTSSEGLLNLINDILDFSKIEAGQLDIYNRTFRLQVLSAGISNMFDIQFREKGVDFEINVSPAVPDNVFNDRWRLNQVLTNLLANSLKFTEKGRVELTIDYSGKDDVLTFKVIDTGIGINSEYMDRIFTPFTQIDDEETSNIANKGAGLGLAICDKLVQLMGGTITASSTYGKGTEFTLEIPANLTEAQETISAEALEKSEETNIDEKNGNRILIVDDNPVNRELILEQFINAGFNDLIVAENGKEAIEQALEHSPDLVLMDIQMPVMDGNEAITHLKSNGFKKPIITLSAYAMRSEIENSLSKGAVGYITKPIDFDTFFSRISAFLEKKIAPVSIPRQEHERRVMAKEPLHIIKDSVSERMRNIFLGDVENKLKDIERILKEDEFTPESVKRLKVIAHGYLGNAEYFGLSELSSISGELEQTIKDEEQNEKILALTKTLDVILKEIYTHNK